MAITVDCLECGTSFTAQRRTRQYCSEACKQRAKRAREWAAQREQQWAHLISEAKCQWRGCGGPLFPDKPERDNVRLAMAHPWWTHRRKYCSPECRNAARRYRYRVGKLDEDGPYRVIDPASDDYAMAEPVPCWRSAEWHELARMVLTAMGSGWVLAAPKGEEHLGVVGLARLRQLAALIEDEDATPAS